MDRSVLIPGLPEQGSGVSCGVPTGATLAGWLVLKGHSLGSSWGTMGGDFSGRITEVRGPWSEVLWGGCQLGPFYSGGWGWLDAVWGWGHANGTAGNKRGRDSESACHASTTLVGLLDL